MSTQSLFYEQSSDEVIIRNPPRSDYDFLTSTTDSKYVGIREMIDDWYSRYPTKEKNDIRGRFRSPDATSHQGAFFELLLHELHLKLGADITTHQETESDKATVPDFYVVDSNSSISYVEATVVTGKSKERQADEARFNDLLRGLNKLIDSPKYWLSLESRGFPKSPSSAKPIAIQLNEKIASLNYNQITTIIKEREFTKLPKWSFNVEGCVLIFEPFPKGDNAKTKSFMGPIGIHTGEVEFVDNRSPIRNAITRKANHYGRLAKPFIVALNCLEPVDDIDIMDALFGQEQFRIPIGLKREITSDDISFSRKPDGAWVNPIGPQYSRISGVLIAVNLRPWSIRDANICLYHNPWADLEYSSVLVNLDQSSLAVDRMQKIKGDCISDILDINSYQ